MRWPDEAYPFVLYNSVVHVHTITKLATRHERYAAGSRCAPINSAAAGGVGNVEWSLGIPIVFACHHRHPITQTAYSLAVVMLCRGGSTKVQPSAGCESVKHMPSATQFTSKMRILCRLWAANIDYCNRIKYLRSAR